MMGRRGIMLGRSPSTEMEGTDEEDKDDDLYDDDDDDDDDNQWLLKLLPHLTKQVVLLEEYARHLFAGGFDATELLEGGYLCGDDLQFMKTGHRRVIEQHFWV